MARKYGCEATYTAPKANERPTNYTLLHYWLKEHGVSRSEFVRRVGCSPKILDYWCDGKCLPTLPYAFQVEKLTAGGVPVSSWLGTDAGRMLWNRIQQRSSLRES